MSPRSDDENTPIDHPLEPGERDKMIRQIHKALIGDPLSMDRDKRGVIAIQAEMHRDMYGDPENGVMGVKVMTQKLWEMKLKFAGMVIAGSGFITLAAWLIENLILGKH
jgi:hypothetical protein